MRVYVHRFYDWPGLRYPAQRACLGHEVRMQESRAYIRFEYRKAGCKHAPGVWVVKGRSVLAAVFAVEQAVVEIQCIETAFDRRYESGIQYGIVFEYQSDRNIIGDDSLIDSDVGQVAADDARHIVDAWSKQASPFFFRQQLPVDRIDDLVLQTEVVEVCRNGRAAFRRARKANDEDWDLLWRHLD